MRAPFLGDPLVSKKTAQLITNWSQHLRPLLSSTRVASEKLINNLAPGTHEGHDPPERRSSMGSFQQSPKEFIS